MSAHTARQLRRRNRGKPDEIGSEHDWREAIAAWQDKRGIKPVLIGKNRAYRKDDRP